LECTVRHLSWRTATFSDSQGNGQGNGSAVSDDIAIMRKKTYYWAGDQGRGDQGGPPPWQPWLPWQQ
jgi:hypothetical protein